MPFQRWLCYPHERLSTVLSSLTEPFSYIFRDIQSGINSLNFAVCLTYIIIVLMGLVVMFIVVSMQNIYF